MVSAPGPAPTPAPPAPATCSVELENQHSKSHCTLHESFDCIDGTQQMWAASGCRGAFKCNGLETVCDVLHSSNATCTCGDVPPGQGEAQVWLRPTADGGAAVVVHNPGAGAVDITVSFADVPKRSWGAQTALKVRDLWEASDVGSATGSYTAKAVRPHASVFLKLAA